MNTSIQNQVKKFYTLLCLLGLLGTVKAQSTFNILPTNSITGTVECNDSSNAFHFAIENPGTKNITLQWRVKTNTLPTNVEDDGCWGYMLCDWNLCVFQIPEVGDVISRGPIKAGTHDNDFKLTILAGQNKGGGTLTIELFEKDFPSNAKTITWNITGCKTGKDCTSGISETAMNADFMVYPNPSTDFVNVELKSSFTKNASIQLYNLTGEKVMELTDLKTTIQKIDLTGLSAGGYFIKYNSGNGYATKKIFKTQ